MKNLFRSRFSVLFSVLALYIILSFLVRIVLLIWSAGDADLNLFYILRAFFTGFCYDVTIGSLFLALYAVYLLIFPKKWIGSSIPRILCNLLPGQDSAPNHTLCIRVSAVPHPLLPFPPSHHRKPCFRPVTNPL